MSAASLAPEVSRTLFAGQNRALQLLASGADLNLVFEALVQTVETDLKGKAVGAILVLDAEGKRLCHGAAPSLPDDYNRAIDGIEIGPDIGTCCAAASRNEVVITADIENDPGWSKFKALPLALGLRAAWSMPIRSTQGQVLGTFGTYFREIRAPTPTECEIVGVLAKTAALGIEQRATEWALREELETRVIQRTEELEETNARLRTEIVEQKKIAHTRQQLRQRLANAEEDERRRISRELHDQVGQHLTALKLGLNAILRHLDPKGRDELKSLENITETLGKKVHDLALELRPAALDDLGLPQALAHLLEEWSGRTRVTVKYKRALPSDKRLPPSIETTIYRLVEEALANVTKHAGARGVAVAIECCDDHVMAVIEDDGKGFDSEHVFGCENISGLGLRGMQERIATCGGTLNIESVLGKGTTVFARIPLLLINPLGFEPDR